jgi:GTP cyclohydrolase I
MKENNAPMQDVQSEPSSVPLPLDRVGVKDLRLPFTVRVKGHGDQQTVADVELAVDLPSKLKGTHMSRFVEALKGMSHSLSYDTFKCLMADITERLAAKRAYARLRFPYFLEESAPVSGSSFPMGYDCQVEGEYEGGRLRFTLGVAVPVMTVCPCSKAICDEGAHSQRALIRIRARFTGFLWLEDLIVIARSAGSSPVYALLKREDEKRVTEDAFRQPAFVEDAARAAALGLSEHPQITWFEVRVESQESIHDHSAFASLSMRKNKEKANRD